MDVIDQTQLFEEVVASSYDAIMTKTLDGTVTSWNPAAAELFGYSAAEMIGRPMITLFPADRLDEEADILQRIARGQRLEHYETVRVHKKGRRIHVSVTISPLRDNTGRIVGASKIVRDISDRIDREHLRQQLRAETQQMAAIVQGSDDAIVTKTLAGIVTSWNPAAERMFGYTAAEMIGQPMTLVFPPELVSQEAMLLRRIAAGERVQHFETERLHKDGHRLHVSATLSPLRDSMGTVVGVSKIARDISDRLESARLRQELETRTRQLAAIVESSDDAIISKTLLGTVTSWNQGAERMFGYRSAEMLGKPLARIIPQERLHEETVILERIARGERVDHFETQRQRRDGRLLHVSTSVSPIRDAAGTVVGAAKIARDISERVEAEQHVWAQAHLDALTALPNRRHFLERLEHEIARAVRSGESMALLFVDLDHFKQVNDSLGHQAGDALLLQAAERMRSCLREIDFVARLGGDEFTALLPAIKDIDDVGRVAARMLTHMAREFIVAGVAVRISASVGAAIYPTDGADSESLLQSADRAMYASKRQGGNTMRYFAPDMEPAAPQRGQAD